MRLIILIFSVLYCCIQSEAQIYLKYDAAGNRVYRGPNSLYVVPAREDWSSENDSSGIKTGFKFTVNVFPNPVSELLNITIQNYPSDSVSYFKLIDLNGNNVIKSGISSGQVAQSTAGLPVGTYLMQLYIGSYKKDWKIIKE